MEGTLRTSISLIKSTYSASYVIHQENSHWDGGIWVFLSRAAFFHMARNKKIQNLVYGSFCSITELQHNTHHIIIIAFQIY